MHTLRRAAANVRYWKQEVVGEGTCPQCNAEGRIVVAKRKRTSHFWEQVFICDKCKYTCAVPGEHGGGPFMSDVQKRSVDARRELMKKYDAAQSPAERGKIMAALRAIDAREKNWLDSL